MRVYVRVAIVDKMVADACVNCHNARADSPKTDWQLGDVRGILEVDIPIDSVLANGRVLSMAVTIGLVILLFAILAIVTLVFRQTITRPLNRLKNTCKDIAKGEGDLTIRLDDSTQDEIGQVAKWFNHFLDKMQRVVGGLSNISQNLDSSAKQLGVAATDSYQGIDEQKSQMEQLSVQ